MDLERTSESPKSSPEGKGHPYSSKTDFIRAELNPGLSTSTRDRVAAYDSPYTSRADTTNLNEISRPSQLMVADGAQKACILLGSAFILIGLVGFGVPGFFGTHLSPSHNFVHLISGIAALYVGTKRSSTAATRFAFIFGTLYGVLGLTGFLFGSPGTMSMPMMSGRDPLLLPLVRGTFELGLNDHILHVVIATLFLIPAFSEMSRRERIRKIRESSRY